MFPHHTPTRMETVMLPPFRLLGLQLPTKTSNKEGRSTIDCGNLWSEFFQKSIADKISEKVNDEIYAVYFDYEGDHTKPYSFFIGCKVNTATPPKDGLSTLLIPSQNYTKVVARGKMPDCIANAWRDIWKEQAGRTYQFDFEVYDARSQDWNNAEVDIFLSVE